jgi:hypothetical protein
MVCIEVGLLFFSLLTFFMAFLIGIVSSLRTAAAVSMFSIAVASLLHIAFEVCDQQSSST